MAAAVGFVAKKVFDYITAPAGLKKDVVHIMVDGFDCRSCSCCSLTHQS
tara:strand:- start:532 stop:678 length:147 start_codon:yes stop_codon:yes gene_type:complete